MKKILITFFLFFTSLLYSDSNPDTFTNCTCSEGYYWVNTSTTVSSPGLQPSATIYDANSYTCNTVQRSSGVWNFYSELATSDIYDYYTKTSILDTCTLCNDADISFPLQDTVNFTYSSTWLASGEDASAGQQMCSDANGTIETAKTQCLDYERCKIPIIVQPCDGIIVDGLCQDCVPNSSPNVEGTSCDCDYGYKEELGSCVPDPDRDGDGVSNDDDAFPDDATETTDTDKDGIGDNADTDDDNDGFSDYQESLDGTDSKDSSSNSGVSPDGGGDNTSDTTDTDTIDHTDPILCPDSLPLGLNEVYRADDCKVICSTGYVRDASYVCSLPIEDEDCSHTDDFLNWDFQSITSTCQECYLLIQNNGGSGYRYELPNCTTGTCACFYNIDDDNTETNSSEIGDSNTTDSFDDSEIVSKLIDIKNINTILNTKLDSIDLSITSQTSILASKLDSLSTIASNASSTNEQSIKNQSAYLGTKLDNIKNAIDNKSIISSSTDMTQTNGLLSEISEKMVDEESELEYDNTDLNNAYASAKTAFDNTLVSFTTSYNDMVSLFNGAHSPTVTSSADCFLSSGNTAFGGVNFDFSILSTLRPAFQFFLNIVLLFMTIKFYTTIARDLAKYFIGA